MLLNISVFICITEIIKLIITSFILSYIQIIRKRIIIKFIKAILKVTKEQKAEPNIPDIISGQFIIIKCTSVLHESNKTNKFIYEKN